MERNERQRANALDRYWDAVQRGESPVRASGIDEMAEAVIQHLGQPRAALSPGSARRIREDLASHARDPGITRGGAPGTPALAPPLRLPAAPVSVRLPRAVVQLTSMFMLLLVLAFSALLLWPGSRFSEHPTVLPAPPDVAADVLLTISIPERAAPRWKVAIADLIHASIPPDSSGTIDAPMLRVEYTLKGQYAVRSDAPLMVVQAGNTTPREMQPGTEITLNPGDTLISPPDSVSEYANQESRPAEMLTWTVNPRTSSTDLQPRSWGIYASESRNGITPQDGPIDFQLHRVVLEPDATFPASPDALQMAVTVSENAKDYTVAKTRDGGRRNLGKEPVTIMVVTVRPAEAVSLMP